MQSPILIYDPDGSFPAGTPGTTPPVYSQTGTTQLVEDQDYVDVVFGSIQTNDEWVLVDCHVENEIDPDPLNIWPGIITDRTAAGFRIYVNGLPDSGNYYLHWAISGVNIVPSVASTYSLTGPSAGAIGVASTFTVALPPSTTFPVVVTIIPNDSGAGGAFSPTSVTISTGSASATFTYTPVVYGPVTISVTNSSTLIDPVSLTFSVFVSTYTMSGPSSGVVGAASTNFTVAFPVGGVAAGTVTVTPHDGSDGTFTPTTVGLTTGAPSATFTYTAGSAGSKTISVTNNGGLTNPGSISYLATTPFSPGGITGLKLWLKADSLTPVADGTTVTPWPDNSGNGYDVTGGAGYYNSVLNGKPVLRFVGSGATDYQNLTSPILPGGTTGYTIFVVAKAASVSAGTHAVFYTGSLPSALCLTLRRETADLKFYHYNGIGFGNPIEVSGIVAGAWNYITCDWDGANVHMWRNGTLKGTSASTAINSAGNATSIAFDQSVGGNFWDGDVAEILIYNSSLSGTDRGNVESYLAAKYGL